MTAPGVVALAYVVVGTPDPGPWRPFLGDLLGMSVEERGGGLRARLDERAWRIAVEAAPDTTVTVGLEARDDAALDGLAAALEAAGHEVAEDPATAATRQVRRLVCTTDPDGRRVELVAGCRATTAPLRSPTGVRFVTGDGGLGHLVLLSPHVSLCERFIRLLGFTVTDIVEVRGTTVTFLRCNSRHHSVALVPAETAGVHHLMVEVDDLDDVGRVWDRAVGGAAPVRSGLGRHSNDGMVSLYLETPDGFGLEYGYGGIRVGGDHTPVVYDAPGRWGHHPVTPQPTGPSQPRGGQT